MPSLPIVCRKSLLAGSMMASVKTADDLAKVAIDFAKDALFSAGDICPTVIMIGDATWILLSCPLFESEDAKTVFSQEIGRVVALYNPRLMCFFHEAWTLNIKTEHPDEAKVLQEHIRAIGGVSKHPNRVECIYVIAESMMEHQIRIAVIKRSKSEKVRSVVEMEPIKHSSQEPLAGRFAGWIYRGVQHADPH